MNTSRHWYSDGLNFTCTRCSRCCRHDSGYVFLSEADIHRLSRHFGIGRRQFVDAYCTGVDFGVTRRLSLKEQDNFDCVFWKDGGCSVYTARPLQCRAYPFWPQNIDSPASWEDVQKECPGVGVGERHDAEKIDEWLELRQKEPFTTRE
jgi:Fe-S-cluster containining protein